DLQVGLLRRIDRQPAAFRTHLCVGVHFEAELVDIKIVGARLVQHKDRKMVRFSYHYFLQNCDVGRIQGSEGGALLENCYSRLRAAKKLPSFSRRGAAAKPCRGGYCLVRTGSVAAG